MKLRNKIARIPNTKTIFKKFKLYFEFNISDIGNTSRMKLKFLNKYILLLKGKNPLTGIPCLYKLNIIKKKNNRTVIDVNFVSFDIRLWSKYIPINKNVK